MKAQTIAQNKWIIAASASLLLSSCGFKNGLEASSQVSATSHGAAESYSKVDVNAQPLHKTVCDPFNNTPVQTMEQGISASLHYLVPGMPILNNSLDYVSSSKKSDQKLFFADMNVPTRAFSTGFTTQTNDVLKDDSGKMLIENFAVKFDTILKLGENDAEGYYELATLSDDGSTLKIGADLKTIINNEGEHETRMGCSTETVYMSRDTQLPVQLTYYQGPRYFIANVLIWRKANTAGQDQECGKRGNSYYFDPNKNSSPLAPFNGLVSRGWKVVGTENFFIPKSEVYNPCVEGTAPIISEFRVLERVSSGVFLGWNTDIPATSQIKLINKATGEVILTQADNGLRTVHHVQVMGLQSKTTYTAQAVSVSEDLGNSLSPIIEVTTP